MNTQVSNNVFSRALSLNPVSNSQPMKSDTINIPYAGSEYRSSVPTSIAANKIIDTTANFLSTGTNPLSVKVGDIVWNVTSASAGSIATVVSVDSATQLTISSNILGLVSETYKLFSASDMYFGSTPACYLLVGTASTGIAKVMTIGGDIVTFYGLTSNTLLPVQIVRLYNTTTTIATATALW